MSERGKKEEEEEAFRLGFPIMAQTIQPAQECRYRWMDGPSLIVGASDIPAIPVGPIVHARACVVVSFLTQHSSGSELSQPDQNFFAHISNVCGHSSISLHWSFSLASVVHYGRVVRHDDGGVFRRSFVGSPVRSISSASTVITTTEPRESEDEREREREREKQ